MKMHAIAVLVVASLGLAGCVSFFDSPSSHHRNASSLVDYLYQDGGLLPASDSTPQLRIPLHVGVAFLPSQAGGGPGELDLAHQDQLLERIKQRFSTRSFVSEITLVPAYYLTSRSGFDGLAAVQRVYRLDLIALVSYDQVMHEDQNYWSLGYLTIVGAYVLKGERHDVSTLVDLAVVDPVSRSLVLRAGGTDTRHGNTTLVDSQIASRESALAGYETATEQMITHFDAALSNFEADVKAGKAYVQVSRKNPGNGGGGGSLDLASLLFLLLIAALLGARRSAKNRPAVTSCRQAPKTA